mmetsp:Transcript_86476/g.171680  ORF Transcript_86476/g.171680 Transcript_86476/m.171680 type:complete len:209 (-) Transcript_86476:2969-3595(-)
MQAFTTQWRLYLCSVIGAHRQDTVGHLNPATEKVYAIRAIYGTEEVRSGVTRQAQVCVRGEFAHGVLPLVANVVDHEHCPCSFINPTGPVLVCNVGWHQPTLPVVGEEKNILAVGAATEVEDQRCLQGGQRQQRKAEEVVAILATLARVPIKTSRPVVAEVLYKDIIATTFVAVRLPLVIVAHLMKLAIKPETSGAQIVAVFIICISG